MSRQLRHLISFCLLVCAAACNRQSEPAPLFTKGIFPLVFKTTDFPPHPKTGAPMQTSKDCAPCHETAYRNWSKTRHRVALTNELYRESHEREPSPWCVNCHAPLRLSGSEKQPYREDEGVSCLVCHVREGKIMVKQLPAANMGAHTPGAKMASVPAPGSGIRAHSGDTQTTSVSVSPERIPAHTYLIDERLNDERFCEGCHEFNFPTAATAMREGNALHYTEQPMQSTVSEYRSSAFYGSVTCSGCHLFPYTAASHSFPGGHALGRLKNDLRLEVTRTAPGQITLRLYAQGIGHAFPTGDLFRTLRVRLSDSTSNHTEELELRHYFEPISGATASKTLPLKRRVREETLPPPQLDYISMREYTLPWPLRSNTVVTELYIDYLNQLTTMTTRLPPAITRPLIKRERHRLPKAAGVDAKG